MTFRAIARRARVREVPITFRDRRVGQSKMSRRIIVEALVVVVQLRFDELRGRDRGAGRRRAGRRRVARAEDAGGPAGAAGQGRDRSSRDESAWRRPRRPAGEGG